MGELAMRREVTVITILASSLPLLSAAPQFLTDTIRSNCRSEVTTVFEETETESVNKVICQTEFRDECVKIVEPICRNVTSGEEECHSVDNFVCVDSMTNKCGIEKVLKNVSYTETVCDNKPRDICEYEIVDGKSSPVTGSCVTKTMEECQELCRNTPIKDCQNVENEVCVEKQTEVCESLETEKCEIVPHEECQQVVEIIPTKISKKVTRVVCAEDGEKGNEEAEEPETDDTNNVINEIFEIFGVRNNNENEVEEDKQEAEITTEFMIDDGLLVETSSDTTTPGSTTPTSTTTSTTSTTTTN